MPESLCKLAETNPDGLGRRHQDGARSPRLRLCHLLPPGLFIFRFTSGCSGRDPAQATFSKQIHPAVGLGTAPEPVCPVKLLQALASGSSASLFSPQRGCVGGEHHAWAESSPCVTTHYEGWVSERPELCPIRALHPMVSQQRRCGSHRLLLGWGLLSHTMGSFVWKKKKDEFWNMFISCSLHLVVVSINMPLTHAH